MYHSELGSGFFQVFVAAVWDDTPCGHPLLLSLPCTTSQGKTTTAQHYPLAGWITGPGNRSREVTCGSLLL